MSSSGIELAKFPPKAFTFDIFGTVVNWRETVTSTLISSAADKTSSSSRSANLSPQVRRRLSELTDDSWRLFAQQWRDSYKAFTKEYRPDEDPWKDIDTHHRMSLEDLLETWSLASLYNEIEIEDLSKIWHFLDPWADSALGLQRLGTKFITSSLSNGNQSLLRDLNDHGDLGLQVLQSAEDFKTYKPHPSVYLGAAKRLGLQPPDIAMVAAHLSDLKAARDCGYRTIYVEREQEEDWRPGDEEYENAKIWVDMWVTKAEAGFIEVSRRFGVE